MENKEKRNHVLTAKLCVVFLIMAYMTAGAQVRSKRGYDYNLKKETTVITPIKSLKFGAPNGKDTIYLTPEVRSADKSYGFALRVFYPKSVEIVPPNLPELNIWFSDSTTGTFSGVRYWRDTNEIEYQITAETLVPLRYLECIFVSFEGIGAAKIKSDKAYFVNFLKEFLQVKDQPR